MMIYDDLKKRITAAMENPESAPGAMLEILSDLKKDYDEAEAATATIADLTARNQTLHDTNMRLFLAQTGPASDSGSDDDDGKEQNIGDILAAMEKED